MKRLMLIFPRPISEMPTGFSYLNAIIKKNGWECKAIVNTFKHNYSNDDIIKEIMYYGPSIIGINIGTLRILDTYKLIEKIHSINLLRNILIIAGGPHATTRPEEVLKAGVDIVIRNEGEITLSEILNATRNYVLLDKIKGISFKDCNGNVFHTPMREYTDFKDLPKPDYDCFNYDDFKTSDGLIKGLHRIYCSRGCPGMCLTGDTIVHTIKGDFPIRELVGQKTKVLTRNPDTQEPIYADAINIAKIKENAEIVRVHFTDGSFIDCTPDHKFKVFKSKNQYIEESEWDVEAKDLQPKQQVRAINFYINKERTFISTRRNIELQQHRIIMEALIGRKLNEDEVVHHLDNNPSNNLPSNLLLLSKEDHTKLHKPEHSARMFESNPMKNKEVAKKQKETFKDNFEAGKYSFERSLESRFRYRESKLGEKNPRFNKALEKHQVHKSRIAEVNHRIAYIEKLDRKEDVYCLEVPNIHWFYANKVLVHNCTFCDSAIFGRKVRYRPLQDVIGEITERYTKFGITSFIIADDTFTANKQYVRDFCKALKDNNLPIIWGCSTRANAIDADLYKTMKDAGCYMVGLGIESGDSETLIRIKKNITLEQAHNAIKLASSVGMRVYVNLMTGFPWETVDAVKNNIKLIKERFNDVFIYQVSGSLCPYPGTGIYEEWKDKADIKDWWLRPDYQDYGIQIHQNTTEPYKLSTYYQRKLYDDTYIWEEKFFHYSKEYKKAVKEMAFLVGKRLLLSETEGKLKRIGTMALSRISRFFYELNPNLEKSIVPYMVSLFDIHDKFHDRGPLGYKRK